MASDMKILFVFNFETGDASCSWWQEIAVVYGSNEDIKTIEDGFCSYFESSACEDKNYDEIVKDVLNSLGLKWERITKIPECDCLKTLWV